MAMAMSRSAQAWVVLLLVMLVGCQAHLLAMDPSSSSVHMMSSFDMDPRRVLAASQYYISYGALNANRAPCPSGQGRSYYTANCQPSAGDPDPYSRSCDQITRCARG